jgi:SAM-dependent methyltransferase
MTNWRCPLCIDPAVEQSFDSVEAPECAPGRFSVVRCRRCGLISLQPRPQPHELVSFYPQDYEPFWRPLDEEPHLLRRWSRRRSYALRCRMVRRAQREGGRLLDVGCGTGGFLRELCRDGQWQGLGVDIHQGPLSVARRQGVNVYCGELCALRTPAPVFDVVTLWEVIEHVPDPRRMLSDIRRLLRPGGTLLLSTPNVESWQARVWRRCWAGWELPRHVQVFSLRTLRQILETTGFRVVRRIVFPTERFYAMESARRCVPTTAGPVVRALAWLARQSVGLGAWPLLRLVDRMPWATSLALEVCAQ